MIVTLLVKLTASVCILGTAAALKPSVCRQLMYSSDSRISPSLNHRSATTGLFQYGSDRTYVGDVMASQKRLTKNASNLITVLRAIISFPITLIIYIVLFPFKLLAFLSSAIGGIFKVKSSSKSTLDGKSVVSAAVTDDVIATKKLVSEKIIELDTSKKFNEDADFAAKLAKANAAAEVSLEQERAAAKLLAASLKAKILATSAPAASVQPSVASTISATSNISPMTIPEIDPEPIKEFISSEMSPFNQIKALGENGLISYFIAEIGFWTISLPILIASYHSSTGEWLDITIEADQVYLSSH